MNNKLIFRILGALSSALIVVSVFLPYVSVTGYSESLWNSYQVTNTLYLPIMIIVFGTIGVIFFALNIKTEFAYATSGALLFFVIMMTFDVANQGTFNTLSVGYYSMAVGTVLTGVMAFLCNINSNKNKLEPIAVETNPVQMSPLNRIDSLTENIPQESISPIQPIVDTIEPIQINPIPDQAINMVTDQTPILEQSMQSISEPTLSPIPEVNMASELSTISEANPIPEQPVPVMQPQINIPNQVDMNAQLQNNGSQLVNPVVQEFMADNPQDQNANMDNIKTDLNQNLNQALPTMNTPVDPNPVVQEFMADNPQDQNANMDNIKTDLNQNLNQALPTMNAPVDPNPVVQGFSNMEQGLQFNQNTTNNNETDIFGQPVNR